MTASTSISAGAAITPARLGLAYSPEDTAQLVEKVGPARAKDMLFSARMVPAAEALAIGLIDRVEPDADLWRAAPGSPAPPTKTGCQRTV